MRSFALYRCNTKNGSVKRGIDISELEHIIDEYQDKLYQFAFFRLGDYDQAQDVVQDAFVALYGERNKVRRDNLKAWLYRVVYNKCVSVHRQRQRRTTLPLSYAAKIVDIDGSQDASDGYLREYRRIEGLLQCLPEEQATVVKMRCTDGLSFVEIAAILDISDNTAKSRYRYAIAKLRKEFKHLTFEDE